MSQNGQIVRTIVFLGLGNSYLNFMYLFCYKYLTIKHGELHQAIGLGAGVHLLFSTIIGIFFLLVLKPHAPIDRAYVFDTRLRREFSTQSRRTGDHLNYSCLELNKKQARELARFVRRRKLKIITRNSHGQIAACFWCQLVQPDRCYHCHQCNRCILKRDHHCPWFNTCVGFVNQKYYLLLLVYVQVYLIVGLASKTVSMLRNSDSIVEKGRDGWFQFVNFHFAFVFDACLALPIQLLIVNNFYLACNNLTHIEYVYPPRLAENVLGPLMFQRSLKSTESVFDLGSACKNLRQIFGERICLALLPVWTTPGDGYTFSNGLHEDIV